MWHINFNYNQGSKKRPASSKTHSKGSKWPENANNRTEFGHWEGDLILSNKGSKACVLSLAERKTRFYITLPISNKTSNSVIEAINGIQSSLGLENCESIFKSITFDNGSEFLNFKELETCPKASENRTTVYYADPYSSWQRGTNENTSGFIRKFMPKGTNFSKIPLKRFHKVNR